MNDELVVLGTITLPGVGSSAGHLRLFARDLLGRDHPRLDDIGLCLTEKFSNAIKHTASGTGGGRVTVTLAAGRGLVRTEVTDEGAGGRRPALPGPGGHLSEHGRGLLLRNALSERWGYEPAGPGTTVWADFPMLPGVTDRRTPAGP